MLIRRLQEVGYPVATLYTVRTAPRHIWWFFRRFRSRGKLKWMPSSSVTSFHLPGTSWRRVDSPQKHTKEICTGGWTSFCTEQLWVPRNIWIHHIRTSSSERRGSIYKRTSQEQRSAKELIMYTQDEGDSHSSRGPIPSLFYHSQVQQSIATPWDVRHRLRAREFKIEWLERGKRRRLHRLHTGVKPKNK